MHIKKATQHVMVSAGRAFSPEVEPFLGATCVKISVPNPTPNNALHPKQRKPPAKRAGGDLPLSIV